MIFLLFYQILSVAIMPILIANFLYRVSRKKDKIGYFFERIGLQKGFSGQYIYIHAASVGESKSSIRLIKSLLDRGFYVKITTMTITARRILEDIFANEKRVKIRQVPFDSLIFILIFYIFNRPKKVFIIESELWINLIKIGSIFSDVYYLNARLSDKSYDFWFGVNKFLGFNIFRYFKKIFVAEFGLVGKIANFNHNVEYYGNLKSDYYPIYSSIGRCFSEKFATVCKKKTIFLANTHVDEEVALIRSLNAHVDLDEYRLVIAPRYISRVDEISRQIGLSCVLFSDFALDSKKADFQCLIVDEMGVMSSLYDACDFVFIGGSLLDSSIGGHSPLEGVFHRKAVAIGSMNKNCRDVCNELASYNAIKICRDDDDFGKFIASNDFYEYLEGVDNFVSNKPNVSEIILDYIF
jgi:3-deoxy-D-manno-octulosonic-acid transferase